jgi:radical SAM superfamily enzyme YgiQ (UPF0313 family)
MYTAPQKKFKPKAEDQVLDEIQRCAELYQGVKQVFLADGDALALSFRRLESILLAIREYLPSVVRVSAYCLPQNLRNKSLEQLQRLHELGLGLVYVGAESGSNTILRKVNKSETFDSTLEALLKLKAAGIQSSVMIISGLGGKIYSQEHALESARLINAAQPEYLATLTLFFRNSPQRFIEAFGDDYMPADAVDIFRELHLFLSQLELTNTVFRSDHVSNYLILKGILSRDKATLLTQTEYALRLAESGEVAFDVYATTPYA